MEVIINEGIKGLKNKEANEQEFIYKIEYVYKGEKKIRYLENLNSYQNVEEYLEEHPELVFVISVKKEKMPFVYKIKHLKESFLDLLKNKKLSYYEIAMFFKEIATLQKAGLDIETILNDVRKNTSKPYLKDILWNIEQSIKNGQNLYESFLPYKKVFGNIAINMIKLAQETGDLVSKFLEISDIYLKMHENRKKIKAALRYPVITLTFIILAFVGLVTFVVPKFENIFKSYHANLPLPTKILLFLEHSLKDYGGYIFLGFVLLLVVFIIQLNINPHFKRKWDEIKLKLPVVGKMIEYSNTVFIFGTLFSLLEAGVNIVSSLKIIKENSDNLFFKEKITIIINELEKGKPVSEAFENVDVFDELVIKLLRIGETSGELNKLVLNIKEHYEELFNNKIDNLKASIEPILLFFIAGMVLLIALGIFLPMWNMSQVILHKK